MSLQGTRRNSLLTMTLIFSLVLMAILAGTVFVDYRKTTQNEMARTRQILLGSASEQARIFDARLRGQFNAIRSFASSMSVQDSYDMGILRRRLAAIVKNTDFINMSVADASGRNFYADGAERDISDREYFRRTMAGEEVLELVDAGRVSGVQSFIISTPVRSGGVVRGAVVASFDEAAFRDVLITEAYAGEAYSFVCSSEGRIVIGSREKNYMWGDLHVKANFSFFDALREKALNDEASLAELQADLRAHRSGLISYAILDGVKRIAVYVPLSVNGWWLFNVLPDGVMRNAVSSAVKEGSRLYSVVLLAAFLLVSIVVLSERQNLRKLRAEQARLEEAHKWLQVSEQEYRIAAQQTGKVVMRYDVAARRMVYDEDVSQALQLPKDGENFCESMIASGRISPESLEEFRTFFSAMERGDAGGTLKSARTVDAAGKPQWCAAEFTMVYDAAGAPLHAVISLWDITEEREKEVAYKKWEESVAAIDKKKIALFEHNLTLDQVVRESGGMIDAAVFRKGEAAAFNDRTKALAEAGVYPDEQQDYIAFLNRERLISDFYQGRSHQTLDFRCRLDGEGWRWLRVDVQLVQYADSKEVKGYLLYSDVDQEKRRQMELKRLSEEDALTGALNRDAFIKKCDWALARSAKGIRNALILIDLGQFKRVNALQGRQTGDQLLEDLTRGLRSITRDEDFIGRLGGDEFALCLKDVPYDALVGARAQQVCEVLRRQIGTLSVTASLGIALSPKDGKTFGELYERADVALFHRTRVKQGGFTFYKEGMTRENFLLPGSLPEHAQPEGLTASAVPAKRSVLLVGDLGLDPEAFQSLFDGMNLITAEDGTDALRLIKEYDQDLSAILLDLSLKDMDGLEVLKIIERDPAMFSVPVILFGGGAEKFRSEAIRLGAEDFISKPVDLLLMKARLSSAVVKLENERLRAQNSYLVLQNAEEQRYRTVLQSTGTVVFEYDWLSRQCVYDPLVNQYLAGRYDSRPFWQILEEDRVAMPQDVAKMRGLMDSLARDKSSMRQSMNVLLKTAGDGRRRWFRYSLVKMLSETGTVRRVLVTLNDVHDEVTANRRLRYLAEYDSLTGLLNRQAFMKRAGEMVSARPGKSYVISCFDIDNFKVVNDRFGHGEGDRLLRHFASVLQKCVDNYNGISCRISADNFALLLPNDPQILDEVAQLRRQSFDDYERPLKITFSVGRYVVEDPSLPVNVMIDRASLAQKSVKGKYGQEEAYYSDQMRAKVLYETRIVNEMESALARGQFRLFLQPQYDTAQKKVVGAEALVRWIHPELGLIPPGSFIPLFERYRFIERMDCSIWEQSCQALRKWIDRGLDPIPLSVNISRVEIEDMNLCEVFIKLMMKYSLPRELLRLEITESAYVENPSRIAEVAGELRACGFIVEMDDFGSGYSSLNILSSAPVDVLKLDMKFLSMQNERRGGVILESVIKMASELGLDTVAEGVETQKQAEFLSQAGCTVHQGYHYSKPLPLQDFERAYYPSGTDVPEA